ncbi:MAG TPA: hypothetical protein VK553_09700, partial [Candidatus Nitrosopolaris rasttigaisensis]|nr:hypothetical protein [Candidatus Nitrosopolaris rasttigaisensis]
MKDSNNHVDKLSESIDKPLPSKNGAERGLTSPFPSNYGQPEALRILGEIAERFINGQTLSTRADLNNIIKSVRGEGKDELTRNSNNASEYDDSGYQTRILSPEQNMLIKQQGISIANPGQELEAYGSGIRGILRGYFPTVEYRLGLIGFESIEARRTKVDIGELEKILDECREKFEKYAEMSINYRKSVEELPNFAVLQNSSKYKEDLGQHEDAFMSLQTALEEFSTQFLDKRAALQRIFKAAQEIVDKFKQAPEYKGKLVWETSRYLPMLPLDIIENPEFPRGIVANPKLARKMLANPELLEDIRYKPGLLKSIIGNRKLAQDVQANRNLAQDV